MTAPAEVKESEIRALFNYIDKDKSGAINLEVGLGEKQS